MRVAGGSARGKPLLSAKGKDLRPTSNKVRSAIFSVLDNVAKDWDRVLDLYAGTGALGIEALSRGSERADFVERAVHNCEVIKKNLLSIGFYDRAKVYCRPLPQALKHLEGKYGIVLLDPPYDDSGVKDTLEGLLSLRLVDGTSTIVLEHSSRAKAPVIEGLDVLKVYTYGDTSVSIFVPGGN